MGIKENHSSSGHGLHDYKKYELNGRTILVPHGSDYLNHMASFDIHLLPSREDPYPLVVLDAAGFAIPTICFSNAGGTPEFVENDCGYCVAFGDLLAMAHKLNTLVENAELRTKMGHAAREKVYKKHDYEKQTQEIIKLIKSST
jgi:glycosyltransferase involved in cell wall biosynthesis